MASVVAKGSGLISTMVEAARPKVSLFMKYARVELIPPTPGEIPQITAGLKRLVQSAKSGSYKNLTVREAWLNTLVGAEVVFWFYIGECIGKRHFVGYDV